MKQKYFKILTVILFTISCNPSETNIENNIRQHIDQIKIIDTHEHHGYPWMKKHNAFDIGMYMYADLISSGMPEFSDSMIQDHNVYSYWERVNPYLRYVRGTSYHKQFIKNLQVMYNLKSDDLTKAEYLRISAEIDSNYKNYTPWLNAGLENLNIDFMLVDKVWNPFDPIMEHEKFGYVFRFDELVLDALKVSKTNKITNDSILSLLKKHDISIKNLTDYLQFIDDIFKAIKANRVVALKMGLAYHRNLSFDNIDFKDAEAIFALKEKKKDQIKQLQDFLVNYIVKKAGDNTLTIQIHTGYLHGNNGNITNGQPLQLIPLFRRFPETQFVIFHGSYPWTGEFIAIGKEFTNVFVDVVWLPQLSKTAAVRTLHELLDAVPYNKICWGGDVGKIDETAGSLELAKEVFTEVLTERVRKSYITEETAFDICDCVFRNNAIRIYNLRIQN